MADNPSAPERDPGVGPDNIVVPFRLERTEALGRIGRLGSVVDTVLQRHDYPDAVSVVLGEALVLAAILGAGLKNRSRFTLQTQTDGPLNFLVVSFDWPDALRGYATFDRAWFVANEPDLANGNSALFGNGHLAMTIVPGGETAEELGQQYQGIVAMDGQSLRDAAHKYFLQSEQLPTVIHLAVAKHFGTNRNRNQAAGGDGWHWRAGGLIVQKLTWEGGKKRTEDTASLTGEIPPGWDEDEGWLRTSALADTVQAHELTDPMLAPERLLYRLFHEEGVRVFEACPMEHRCKCSRERISDVLRPFPADELTDMVKDDGKVHVTCEFCGRSYAFECGEIG